MRDVYPVQCKSRAHIQCNRFMDEQSSGTLLGVSADETAGMIHVLRQVEILHEVDEADLRDLADGIEQRTYRLDDVILRPGETERGIVILASGTARAYHLSDEGREVTVAQMGQGDIFGLILVESRAHWRSFVVATSEETVVYHIAPAHFRRFLLDHSKVALAVIGLLGRRLADARDLVEQLALYDSETRLVHTLARLASRSPDHSVHETHEELARLVGTRREHVTRILRQLRQRGIVEYQPHSRRIMVRGLDVP